MSCIIRSLRSSAKNVLSFSKRSTNYQVISFLFRDGVRRNLRRSCVLTQSVQIRSAHTDPRANQDPLLEYESLYPLSEPEVRTITSGDTSLEKRLRVLQMEFAVQSVQNPGSVPIHITVEMWKRILFMTRAERKKYLVILCRKQRTKTLSSRENELFPDMPSYESDSSIFEYRLFRNAMYPMIHESVIAEACNRKLAEALDFSPTVIFDCEYERIMSHRDILNSGQQIANAIGHNRDSVEPYNLMLCNLKTNSFFYDTLWNAIPSLNVIPIVHTEQCYTELFPKERLVYLSPHCREDMEFDPKDIYIIGAMVDKAHPGPHSLIKAKSQGIRMASFPLDKYLVWRTGTKSLTLNQVMNVLVAIKQTRNWTQAFECVPKRKVLLRQADILREKKKFFIS